MSNQYFRGYLGGATFEIKVTLLQLTRGFDVGNVSGANHVFMRTHANHNKKSFKFIKKSHM
jgi:hypothetical protein